MSEETQLTIINPGELMRQSTDVAGICKDIVTKTALEIQGRKYVRVEGWQSVATAHGYAAGSRDVERIDGGFRAIGELRRISDGALLATAEGFVGEDEATWFGGEQVTRNGTRTLPKRPDYAIRAMAQTRAISRVCRSAFAHVVVMMDAGLSTTPAEEVPQGGFNDDHIEQRQERREIKARANGKAPIETLSDVRRVMNEPQLLKEWRNVVCNYGKKDGPLRGKELGELTDRNLEFLSSMFLTKDRENVDAKDLPMFDALATRKAQIEEAAHEMRETVGAVVDNDGDQIPF